MTDAPPKGGNPPPDTIQGAMEAIERIDKTINGIHRSIAAMEAKIVKLQHAIVTNLDAPGIEVDQHAGTDAKQREMLLKTLWGVHVHKHLIEERGLFLDGVTARNSLYKMFRETEVVGGSMSFAEQKVLAKWVTCSVKPWRRKDMLRSCKRDFNKLIAAAKASGVDMTDRELVKRAVVYLDTEVVEKYRLVPEAEPGEPPRGSAALPTAVKKFIFTVIANLIPKELIPLLPGHLRKDPLDEEGRRIRSLNNAMDEETESEDEEASGELEDRDENERRNTPAKRIRNGNSGSENEGAGEEDDADTQAKRPRLS